jgi:hypothetical protein
VATLAPPTPPAGAALALAVARAAARTPTVPRRRRSRAAARGRPPGAQGGRPRTARARPAARAAARSISHVDGARPRPGPRSRRSEAQPARRRDRQRGPPQATQTRSGGGSRLPPGARSPRARRTSRSSPGGSTLFGRLRAAPAGLTRAWTSFFGKHAWSPWTITVKRLTAPRPAWRHLGWLVRAGRLQISTRNGQHRAGIDVGASHGGRWSAASATRGRMGATTISRCTRGRRVTDRIHAAWPDPTTR